MSGEHAHYLAALMKATNQGALAQYVRVSADWIVHRPTNVTPVEASGITLVGHTAYHMVVTDGKVKPGQRVFINGGSTSVGAFAIQIAKHIGAHVTASCSPRGEELVRRMGADEVHRHIISTTPHLMLDRFWITPKVTLCN